MFIHLFTVRAEMFGEPSLDSLFVIDNTDVLVMMDEQTYIAAKELSHVPEEVEHKRNRISSYIGATEMRLRFNADIYGHILRLDAEFEIDMDTLNDHIQTFSPDELKDKFKLWEFK